MESNKQQQHNPATFLLFSTALTCYSFIFLLPALDDSHERHQELTVGFIILLYWCLCCVWKEERGGGGAIILGFVMYKVTGQTLRSLLKQKGQSTLDIYSQTL